MEGTVTLSKNEELKIRIIEDYGGGRIKRKEAAFLLGVSEKSIHRWARKG